MQPFIGCVKNRVTPKCWQLEKWGGGVKYPPNAKRLGEQRNLTEVTVRAIRSIGPSDRLLPLHGVLVAGGLAPRLSQPWEAKTRARVLGASAMAIDGNNKAGPT